MPYVIIRVASVTGCIVVDGVEAVCACERHKLLSLVRWTGEKERTHQVVYQACALTSCRSCSAVSYRVTNQPSSVKLTRNKALRKDSRVDLVAHSRVVRSNIDGQGSYSESLDVECQVSRKNALPREESSQLIFLLWHIGSKNDAQHTDW